METLNIQHNDIKLSELLIKSNKLYICDFGWASIGNELGCGIGIWNCNNKKKPGGYHGRPREHKRYDAEDRADGEGDEGKPARPRRDDAQCER